MKWIFPTAPVRDIHWKLPMVERERAWYNYRTDYSGTMKAAADDIDLNQFEEVSDELLDLVD